jgi:hypothetical protein
VTTEEFDEVPPSDPAMVPVDVSENRRPLSRRQRAVLAVIRESIQSHGYPPTIREIGNALGIRSTNGVNDHLRALERKGYLVRSEMKSRSLQVVDTLQVAKTTVVREVFETTRWHSFEIDQPPDRDTVIVLRANAQPRGGWQTVTHQGRWYALCKCEIEVVELAQICGFKEWTRLI